MKIDRDGSFTLDQFLVFVTVVDQNGFAAASRHLGRAQSAITYAIQGLEEETGVQLFDRSTYRPSLTDAGRALLPRARRLLADLADYRQQAKNFSAGIEAGLIVITDVFAPVPLLVKALAEVHREYPSVSVKLVVDAPRAAVELLKNGQAQVGALSVREALGAELQTVVWTEHDLVAVASPSHPLASLDSIAPADLHGHMQLVWVPAQSTEDRPEFGVHALDRWYVTDLATKRTLLLAGLGWGSMPDHMVADDLATGLLVKLNLKGWEGSDRMPHFTTVAAWRRDFSPGPAARKLIETLRLENSLTVTTRQ
jgi:DNA-binding transcriptional LysR family regulator